MNSVIKPTALDLRQRREAEPSACVMPHRAKTVNVPMVRRWLVPDQESSPDLQA